MSPESITITLPPELRSALDEAARQEGLSAQAFVGRAVRDQIFVHRFRLLRERLMAKAQQQGIETDEDVFKRAS
jgi:predicted transcriptional regulator